MQTKHRQEQAKKFKICRNNMEKFIDTVRQKCEDVLQRKYHGNLDYLATLEMHTSI